MCRIKENRNLFCEIMYEMNYYTVFEVEFVNLFQVHFFLLNISKEIIVWEHWSIFFRQETWVHKKVLTYKICSRFWTEMFSSAKLYERGYVKFTATFMASTGSSSNCASNNNRLWQTNWHLFPLKSSEILRFQRKKS